MMRLMPSPTVVRGDRAHTTCRVPIARVARAALALVVTVASCGHGGTTFPWPAGRAGANGAPPHPDVTTLNAGYQRGRSQVLVRRIARATRANLDYAAYHANFMNTDPTPERLDASGAGRSPDARVPFGGAIDVASLTGSLGATPLTAAERALPLAVAPLVELLTSKHVSGGEALEDVAGHVRAETWGLGGGPELARQLATLAYLHHKPAPAGGGAAAIEVWVKVEFSPWFKGWNGVPDDDGDGVGSVYGRVSSATLGNTDGAALERFIRDEYAGRVLTPAEVKAWAHQLASYWYPSYNTDLVSPPPVWPDADTEGEVVAELAGQKFAGPTVVMRGKPLGKPVYNVFVVVGGAASSSGQASKAETGASAKAPVLRPTKPSPDTAPLVDAISQELAAHGGTWTRWASQVAPLHEQLRRKLSAIPAGAKATAGSDGFLFFGQSIGYTIAGDLGKQRRDRNPLPVIAAWRKLLADQGVDLLFVPVPTKEEVLPDELVPGATVGAVVNPFQRKFLLELADRGVEVVDLLPIFLRDRTTAATAGPLFQAQDTHWTDRGLQLAAHAVAQRVKRYPWFKDLSPRRKTYTLRPATFSRHGDLHSRLPQADQSRYQPEALTGQQVIAPDGTPYDDDPDSPIVLLGDSFTGVFQLMDCEHAGVSAHLARELGQPIDLVMSYGGGPNVRQKLLRRGVQSLATKKLVIWMMTARDLHDFWEGWQPVSVKK